MPELRDLIMARLVGDGTAPWGNRVIEREAGTVQEELAPVGELPFLVVALINEDPAPGNVGDDVQVFEVWPHNETSTWSELDALRGQVIARLTTVLVDPVGGRSWLCGYAGSPLMDSAVRSWDAYAVGVRFRGLYLGWRRPLDPRAQALANYTKATWPVLEVDPATWAIGDATPGVYWEPVDGPTVNMDISTLSDDVYEEVLLGRVLAPSPQVRQQWVTALALALPRSGAGGMLVAVQQVRPQADPYRDGQLRVQVMFIPSGDELPVPPAPPGVPLRHIKIVDDGGLTLNVPTTP